MGLIEEENTVFKNKKIVLSSIAIIFALVVSSIFVNYTLANSDSQASLSDANGSGSTSTSLTGLSNIDLAVKNSNDAGKKQTGEDKFRIVQIVPDSYSGNADMDEKLKETVTDSKFSGDAKKLTGYDSTTYLWRYVYAGEYFRLAVFNGYKTISDNMAAGAVTLTTCTVSELNSMDTTAQGILNQADFIYIWANGASDYASTSNDISEDLYNWLDAYATANSHPIALCTGTLCTSEPELITGNNDDYRMGALAYKLITKGAVARYDNVLVTEPDFFKTLYQEANDKKPTPDINKTTKTISDFILQAERKASEGGSDYLNYGTYYKWYEGVSILDFLDGNIPDNIKDSTYDKAGSRSGLTGDRKSWNFDNAKILVISEDGAGSAMFSEITEKNSSATRGDMASADYTFNAKTNTWESVQKAPNSDLTGHMYANGTSSSGTGLSRYVPSGADVYLIDSADLVEAMTNGGKAFKNVNFATSYYKDVKTKSVTGTVRCTDDAGDAVDPAADMYAYLVVENGTQLNLAGTSVDILMKAPLEMKEVPKLDENGQEIKDADDNTVMETVYTYSFDRLSPEYKYKVVVAGDVSDDQFPYDDLVVGVADNSGLVDGSDTDYQYDFNVKTVDEDNVSGYTYRVDAAGTEDENVVVTYQDFQKNLDKAGLNYEYKSGLVYTNLDFSDATKVVSYVTGLHDKYLETQATFMNGTYDKLDLSDYDFVFIDKGTYNKEIGTAVFKDLCSAVESGQYFIVSSKAGDGKGSGDGGDDSDPTIPVVDSPSAKAVADVINASVYRDGSDNKFKVLEIQPDYPIDLEVAALQDTVSTAYTTRSDGTTKITGNYYTVPSDVVSGKSKQELAARTEYYDFDLTKAKIAYAIDGISIGDIQLTQVSTEQLIGMKEDIAATYDLVYIGGDISAMDRNPAEMYKGQNDIGNATSGYTYQIFPTFIMYYHTGTLSQLMNASTYSPDTAPISGSTNMLASPKVGDKYYTTTYLAENGNDLTNTKYQELLTYMASGRPMIISDELTSVYENMQGTNANGDKLSQAELLQGYWYKDGKLERKNYYLDPSSRMYQLVDTLYARHTGANGSNILWGFDKDATQYISDKDGIYGNSLWTKRVQSLAGGKFKETDYMDSDVQNQSWYKRPGTDTVYYNYKVVYDDATSASLNRLVTGSAHRTRLTITTKPVTYQQGIQQTYIKSNRLQFTFQVDGDKSVYNYKLFVDVDKNTKFEKGGDDYCLEDKITNGQEKSLTVALDSEFFGSASWYLEITDEDGNIVASSTGLSKIVNNNVSKSEINVLQVQTMAEGQTATSWGATDTLYFDIESQTAHKIAKYNVFANMTELDNASTTQYAVLGRHENRFGVYEFDTKTDADDYYSNLADELSEDYDINLDLVVASSDRASFKTGDGVDSQYDCLDTMVEEAEKLAKGEKVDGHSQEEYESLAAVALTEYSSASAKVATPKKILDNYLKNAIDYIDGKYTGATNYSTFINNFKTSNEETKKVLQYMQDTGDYYMIFWPKYNTMNHCENDFKSGKMSDDFGADFAKYYSDYVTVKNAELEAKDKYNTYLRRSYGKNFMKNMYSILVLGPSDSFGGFKVDFKKETCQYILDYVSAGGDLFFFHDSMSPYANAGAVNLTKSLISVVGMNRFHVDVTDNVVKYDNPLKLGSYTANNETFYKISYDANGGKVHESTTQTMHIYHRYWSESETKMFSVTEKAGYKNGDSKYGDAYVMLENFDSNDGHVVSGIVPLSEIYKDYGIEKYKDATLQEDTVVYYRSDRDDTYGKVTYAPQDNTTFTDVKYNSPDSTLYYLTPYANNSKAGSGLLNSINANIMDVKQAEWALKGSDTKVYVSALAMTALYYNGNMAGATTTLPYVYAQESYKAATAWSQASNQDQSACAETVKATQLNSGLVTLYPYNISSSLNISGTHQQAFALDLESDNITVWYTLAGSNNSSNSKMRSSKYAADPGDAMEAYFIYTTAYGSGAITYCGAGHSSVTGRRTRNNDERKLFINVIVNSASAVPEMPTIKCYDPKQTWAAEDELPKDAEALASSGKTVYVSEVDSKTDDPEFDYKIGIPEKTKVTKVNIYYDLDYDDSDYSIRPSYTENTDKMIKSYDKIGTAKLTSIAGDIKDIVRNGNGTALTPDDSCYAPYGGNYTYIVVEVYYQGKTVPVYTMIKVKAADPLFDLTDNTIDVPALGDFIAEKKNVFA